MSFWRRLVESKEDCGNASPNGKIYVETPDALISEEELILTSLPSPSQLAISQRTTQ